jgi:predicted DNA-binding transcriptional regulator AlpA
MADTATRRLVPLPEVPHQLGGIGRSSVYRLINENELTRVCIGRRAFVTAESIDRYIDRLEGRK